jgi:predicted  nucleic acid-binding Zn-ribbon protein
MKKTTKQHVDALEQLLHTVESTCAELRYEIDNLSEELQTQQVNLEAERVASIDLAQKFETLVQALHKLAL